MSSALGYAWDAGSHGVFTPEGRAPAELDVDTHNASFERDELHHWSGAPDRWQVYVNKAERGAIVTTWLGSTLGTIVSVSRFKTNLSRNMVALSIRATNGALYYGRFGDDWRQLCRVRKVVR